MVSLREKGLPHVLRSFRRVVLALTSRAMAVMMEEKLFKKGRRMGRWEERTFMLNKKGELFSCKPDKGGIGVVRKHVMTVGTRAAKTRRRRCGVFCWYGGEGIEARDPPSSHRFTVMATWLEAVMATCYIHCPSVSHRTLLAAVVVVVVVVVVVDV